MAFASSCCSSRSSAILSLSVRLPILKPPLVPLLLVLWPPRPSLPKPTASKLLSMAELPAADRREKKACAPAAVLLFVLPWWMVKGDGLVASPWPCCSRFGDEALLMCPRPSCRKDLTVAACSASAASWAAAAAAARAEVVAAAVAAAVMLVDAASTAELVTDVLLLLEGGPERNDVEWEGLLLSAEGCLPAIDVLRPALSSAAEAPVPMRCSSPR
mmetsp:Transcript_15401/g.41677  ORF Transcript_15401/g.41677 Transcript_15401/m.41677 type:complete len:216 (+) Transcript_15401:391-1038(+)